jgi:hypothetical protein
MVVLMRGRVNVQCQCQFAVPLQTCTLLVTFKGLLEVAISILRCITFGFLLDTLALASNKDLMLAWLIFFARERRVARCQTWVTTDTELLSTRLSAGLFTFSRAMTLLLTSMCATLETPPTKFAAPDFVQPTRLVLHSVFSTQARFSCEKWALGAAFLVHVTVVSNLRMAAGLWTFALETTRWRLRAARQRRLQNRTATVTADLIKNGIPTGSASAFVTEFLTAMIRVAAFERAAAASSTNVLRLESLVWLSRY